MWVGACGGGVWGGGVLVHDVECVVWCACGGVVWGHGVWWGVGLGCDGKKICVRVAMGGACVGERGVGAWVLVYGW